MIHMACRVSDDFCIFLLDSLCYDRIRLKQMIKIYNHVMYCRVLRG